MDAREPDATTGTAQTPPAAEWSAAPRRRRRWPWVVTPIAVVAAGAAVAGTVLIAPGTTAAGANVGWLTVDAASDVIAARLAATTVTFEAPSGSATLSAGELGATLDARAVAGRAKDAAPLWNVTAWGDTAVSPTVAVDDDVADAAIRAALPEAYAAPTDATVTFDGASYVVTPAADGSGFTPDIARTAVQRAIDAGETSITVTVDPTAISPNLTTDEATAAAASLNAVVTNAGFYIGTDRTVPVDTATAASWLSYTIADDGTVAITADESKIAAVIPTLAAHVDVPAVDGVTYTTTSGAALPQSPGGAAVPADGRRLGDTSTLAAVYARNLSAGNGGVELPVDVVPARDTRLVKRIEVDLSEQRIYVWEGDAVVRTFATSSGLPGAATETHTGHFTIGGRTRLQDMGCTGDYSYCTEDVTDVMYFNGDEAFHGAWWNDNIGVPASHGCLNMWPGEANWLYDWTPTGTEVWVHD